MTAGADQPTNLLLVEDNPGDRRLVEEAFRESQFETTIHTVSTGEQALDFLYQRGEFENAPEPNVILLDWNLPMIDGEDVLSEVKADFSHIPVVVTTGSQADNVVSESLENQVDAYLTKPGDPIGYVNAIYSIL